MGEEKAARQYLTREIVTEYQKRAEKLPNNGRQDVGERRKLRIELQEKCGLTEIEAINILNGHHVSQYLNKYYRLQNNISVETDPKKAENLKNLEVLEQLERLKKTMGNDYTIMDD